MTKSADLRVKEHRVQLQYYPLTKYETALAHQWTLVQQQIDGHSQDSLILLEHAPVFTLGRSTKLDHCLGNREDWVQEGFDVCKIERGGSVTYHGPGQVVGYPILSLRKYCPGPKAYVGMLEEVLIHVLAEWGIKGIRREKFPGVWVQGVTHMVRKIAMIGVKIKKGITMHGFALNANVDLAPFQKIVPCGIEDCEVTSMERELGKAVNMDLIRKQIANNFSDVFGIQWIERNEETSEYELFDGANFTPQSHFSIP